MKSFIHIQPGVLVIYGSVLDNDWHQHNAIQIIWPESDYELALDGVISHQASIINSEIKHRINMIQGWVMLVEPQSQLGESLQSKLLHKDYLEIANLSSFIPKEDVVLLEQIQPVLKALSLEKFIDQQQVSAQLDPRLQILQLKLNQCLAGECIKPDHWKARTVAEEMGLSEGRFLHLFKEQMHIAWRPYLLWRRLLCAINALQKGSSVTEAAYAAGFSDSAHLSRTFRNNFGMNIRQAGQALLK